MIKNPFLNAVWAAGYIVLVVLVLSQFTDGAHGDGILVPMVILSLLVLSAAIMGFLFVYPSAKLLLENKKEEAVVFFFKTVVTFACFAALFIILLLVR